MAEIAEIDRLLRELERLHGRAMDAVEESPLPDEERREEVGAVHAGAGLISRALMYARDAYLGRFTKPAESGDRLDWLLARLREAVRTADIARYPTPFAVKRLKKICVVTGDEKPLKPGMNERELVWTPWGRTEESREDVEFAVRAIERDLKRGMFRPPDPELDVTDYRSFVGDDGVVRLELTVLKPVTPRQIRNLKKYVSDAYELDIDLIRVVPADPIRADSQSSTEAFDMDPVRAGFVAEVPGIGPEDAEIMVMGEAPGGTEATTGVPFTGPMRGWLGEFLRELGLDRNQVFITNAVHRPRVDARTKDIRATKPEDAEADRAYVEKEIEKVNPKVVILLGRIAQEAWEDVLKAQNRIVIAVPHPGHFARRQDWDGWVEHARQAASKLQAAIRRRASA